MSDESPSFEKLDELLKDCLGRIADEAERICSGSEATDPDACMDSIDREARALEALVGRQLHALQETDDSEPQPLVVNEILQRAVEAFLIHAALPVVVRTRLQEPLPPVFALRSQLEPLLERVLATALGQAGLGGEVSVLSRSEGATVVVEVTAEPGVDGPMRPFGGVSAALDSAAQAIGGQLRIAFDPLRMLHIALELRAARAPTA